MNLKYFYKNARLVSDSYLLSQINDASERLAEKLNNIDLSTLGISQYNQNYCSAKRSNLVANLQLYGHILALCLDGSTVSKEKYTIIDYGGGTGIFTLLAKEYGIGCVIYSDIYDVSCKDVEKISQAVDIKIDYNICGDIDDLIVFLATSGLVPNGICSFDVIEHIYDIEKYFRRLSDISSNQFRIVFGSGANNVNPLIRKDLKKRHLIAEYNDKPLKYGHKDRDTLLSFFKARRMIISNYCPNMQTEKVEMLAIKTRGLNKLDIQASVDEYLATGSMTYMPPRDSNTCDPFTGNWAEHLMDHGWLKHILQDVGFNVEILPGFWGDSTKRHKAMVKSAINCLIKYSRNAGFVFAPYFIIRGDFSRRRHEVSCG